MRAEKLWMKCLPGSVFDVPDPRSWKRIASPIAYSMLNADTIDGYLEPHDAGFYDSMFGNSVSLHSIAMSDYGLHRLRRENIEDAVPLSARRRTVLPGLRPDRRRRISAGLAMHYRLTGDADWLGGRGQLNKPNATGSSARARKSPKEGVAKGLIKFRPYNDYREPVYNYLGNAWCAQGMKLSAEAMKEIGIDGADKNCRGGAQIAPTFSLVDAAINDSSTTARALPIEPDTQRLLKLSKYRGGDYYGLVASHCSARSFSTRMTRQPICS